MKTTALASFLAATFFFGSAHAATVTTGTITSVSKETGVLTVLSEQTRGPIVYVGMDTAVVQFGSGKVATIADVAVGQLVTVEYAMRGKEVVVRKLLIPDPKPAPVPANPVPLSAGERRGAGTTAARDNDITTQPGSKARTDNDITTKPGKKAPGDPDITKKADR